MSDEDEDESESVLGALYIGGGTAGVRCGCGGHWCSDRRVVEMRLRTRVGEQT